jgi:hypothetical protein
MPGPMSPRVRSTAAAAAVVAAATAAAQTPVVQGDPVVVTATRIEQKSFGVRGVKLYQDGIPFTMPDGQGQTASFAFWGRAVSSVVATRARA